MRNCWGGFRMKIERVWAMPNKWTFTIKPIKQLLEEEITNMGMNWVDPFAGKYSPAKITNDLNPGLKTDFHIDALDFLKTFPNDSMAGVLFDPPYSPRQVVECYKGFGKKVTAKETKMSFWSDVKNEMARIIEPGGKAICCGWTSMGLGKNRGFEMTRILLVPHGGSKNDTICTIEIKNIQEDLFAPPNPIRGM